MENITIISTCKGEKTEHTITPAPSGFTCLVPAQGIRVDVPDFVEISCLTTIPCMKAMTQQQWEWISTGETFKTLWKEAFDPAEHQGACDKHIPATIDELNTSDPGLIHVAGMIVQGCEACFAGKNSFFRDPETLLHPATERHIIGMLKKMMELVGGHGPVAAVAEPPKNAKPSSSEKKAATPPNTSIDDKAQCLKWLSLRDPDKPAAKLGSRTLTVKELIPEVEAETAISKQVVQNFVHKRDRI